MSVIAFDLGGTKLASALFTDGGEILFSETMPLDKRKGKDVGHFIIQYTNLLLKKAVAEGSPATSLGICVPGIVYAKSGKVWAPNIPGWDDYPLLHELQEGVKDDIKIKIDSDRACSILGEVWKGNGRGCSDAIFLAVGTGIGAGILANNQVLRGVGDVAGAIGWLGLSQPFQEKFIPCGCFEYNASGEGIIKVAREMAKNGMYPDTILFQEEKNSFSAKDVFAAYDKGDALAIAVVKNAIQYWGLAVANLVSLFNPEKILFGGGVFGPAIPFLVDIYNEAKKWSQPVSIRQVQLQPSALRSEAGLYGAAYLTLKEESEHKADV